MIKSYDISGMSCAACSAAVERAVKKLGVNEVSVNLLTGVMEVNLCDCGINEERIIKAVKDAGFGIEKAKTPAEKRRLLRENAIKNEKKLRARLISSTILMLILMYFSMGHMLSLPLPQALTEPRVLSIIQLLLTLPVLIINRAFFTSGTKHLISGNPNMDSLIAIGSSASLIYGLFAITMIYLGDVHYIHDLYFETAAMIPTLVTLGKFLEGKSKRGTSSAIDMLFDLTPKTAFVLSDGTEKEIPTDKLKIGDTVIIKPGQSISCDGVIISGEGYVDESALTGESIPVYKSIGDKVSAGTTNSSTALIITAEKVGSDTEISKIIRLVESASGSKAPISRLADKISGIFVPIVIIIAMATFLVWSLSGSGFEFAFSRAICVLVISCPCALGLATPLAVTVGTGVAAKEGILIKSAEILEELGRVKAVIFDKTGTLTTGKPEVCDILPADSTDTDDFLTLCASIEFLSEHPIGNAIVASAKQKNLEISPPDSFEAISGMGLCAHICGKKYYGGNLALMEKAGVPDSENINPLYKKLSSEGKTPLFFAKGTQYLGCISVLDLPKSDASRAVKKLSEIGVSGIMLTGDNEITAREIANRIGIKEVCASVTPSQKAEYVKKYQTKAKVAMCGDGINDSPALAAANVGISVSKGTDIALETSDVILMNNDIYSVPRAIAISRETIKNIKISLFWALLYNSLGIPLAAGVLYPAFGIVLNPMLGALAMSLSSICVVLNALRLRKFHFE